MRSLSVLALAAGTLLGAASLRAQSPAPAQPGAAPQAGAHAGHGAGRMHGRRAGRGGREGMGARAALRGITLSEAQRTQLRAVADKYRAERRTLHDQARAQWGGRRGPGEAGAARPDSAARAAFRDRVRDLQQRQTADVRAVLTADQRATFDRNVTELRARAAEFRRDGGRRGAPGAR